MTNQQQCLEFWQARHSIILSTVDLKGVSETSITPFITDDAGNLYILISELAQHTQNILHLLSELPSDLKTIKESQCISGLVVADEPELEQLFARERLTLQLSPSEIYRESKRFSVLVMQFEQKFGEVISLLANLPDFHLIQLRVVKGGYVRGFGQAFTFEGCPCLGLEPVRRK